MSSNGKMMIQPMALGDIERMGDVLSRSKMFGFKTAEEAVALMLMAQAEGNHPAKAAQEYHVIQGRAALKADAMLARFQAAGGVVEWEEMSDTEVSAYFSHPTACPKPVKVDWTIERAKNARLTGKDNWSKYPRQMLKARVISEGVRMTYPGVAVGLYTPEEVMQFDDDKQTPRYVPLSDLRKLRDDHDNLVDPTEPEVLSAAVVGSDVQHVTKSDAIVADLKEKGGAVDPNSLQESEGLPPRVNNFNGKSRGNHFELIDKLAGTTTIQGAKSCVTKHYNKYAYTKSERESIDNALELHIRHLEIAAV